MLLTSLQNDKVKQAVRLRERKERDAKDQFLIEGYRELLRYVNSGEKPLELFFCPALFLGTNEGALIEVIQKQGAQLYECSSAVFHKLSYRDRPDGLLALAKQKHQDLSNLDQLIHKNAEKQPFLIVAEAIEKPGNLGTILRSSDAGDVHGLIVCDQCTDIYNPNVVRASVGTLFTVPVIEASTEAAIAWLRRKQISIVAATPHAEQEFTQTDFTQPIAIAVGTEQLGLSKRWIEEADLQVKIPMCGVADSLNAAMATTLLIYEVLRQRRC